MENHYKLPSFYFCGKFTADAPLFQDFPRKIFQKGDTLSTYGAINNTAYYIQQGVLQFSLSHENGGEKTVGLFGPGSIYPIGVERHHHKMDFEMILTAFTNLEVTPVSYQQLRALAGEHRDFALRLLEDDCDFISYLFYTSTSLAFAPCLNRICDVLYLSLPAGHPSQAFTVKMTQELLATLVGASSAQVERALRQMREEKIIRTLRGEIRVLDEKKLLEHCSDSVRSSFS